MLLFIDNDYTYVNYCFQTDMERDFKRHCDCLKEILKNLAKYSKAKKLTIEAIVGNEMADDKYWTVLRHKID